MSGHHRRIVPFSAIDKIKSINALAITRHNKRFKNSEILYVIQRNRVNERI